MCCIFICRSTASFALTVSDDEPQGWRHIRIQQTGKNASGQTHYLSLSGFEIYGTVTGVCDDLGKCKFQKDIIIIKVTNTSLIETCGTVLLLKRI